MCLVVVLAGCPREPPPACITVDTTCAPAYPPTFTNVYNNTLSVSCGADNSSCHSPAGHQGGLTFEDPQTAFTKLTSKSGIDPSRFRVVAGDPACSLLIVRTDSVGTDYQMPVGDPLPEPERCALIQWVQNGAMQ
jgi:Planctomycete cytochrome C